MVLVPATFVATYMQFRKSSQPTTVLDCALICIYIYTHYVLNTSSVNNASKMGLLASCEAVCRLHKFVKHSEAERGKPVPISARTHELVLWWLIRRWGWRVVLRIQDEADDETNYLPSKAREALQEKSNKCEGVAEKVENGG